MKYPIIKKVYHYHYFNPNTNTLEVAYTKTVKRDLTREECDLYKTCHHAIYIAAFLSILSITWCLASAGLAIYLQNAVNMTIALFIGLFIPIICAWISADASILWESYRTGRALEIGFEEADHQWKKSEELCKMEAIKSHVIDSFTKKSN